MAIDDVEKLKGNLTAGMPGTKFLTDDPNVVTPGQKLNAAVGQFFGNLGATVGPVASDFGRGVSQVAGIPKTIYEGTQNPAPKKFTGGAEPAVNPGILNLARGVNGSAPMIKANATPKGPDKTTQTDFGAIYTPERMSGARDTFNALKFAQPLGVEGGLSPSKGMSEEDLADWRARGVKQGVIGAYQAANPGISNNELYASKNPEYLKLEEQRSNPNNAKLEELSDLLLSATKDAMGEGNLLKRKYDIMAVKAIKDALTGISPLSSFGHFGVEGRKADIAKGHLGVAEGELGVKKGTLELAKAKEARETTESAAKGDYYKANAEESRAKAKYWGDQDKPDKLSTQAQQAWLKGWNDYLKSESVLSDLIMAETPETRDAAIEKHRALYRQLNPPPPVQASKNADGTINVTFADGTTKRFRKKGAQNL